MGREEKKVKELVQDNKRTTPLCKMFKLLFFFSLEDVSIRKVLVV